MHPYDESLVLAFNANVVRPTYAEAGREPDEQYPVWSARTVYDYCSGMSWQASADKHERELREALGLPVPVPEPPSGRVGQVRLEGRVFVDHAGPWCALGASYFPLLWLMRHEPDRAEQNLHWLAARGVEFVRVFADVNGPTWEDRTIDAGDAGWPADVRAAIALAAHVGLRLHWTLFAGPSMAHPARWYEDRTAAWAALVDDQPDRLQAVEIRNETEGCDDLTMRRCASILATILPGVPLALCGTPEAALPDVYRGSRANLGTVHWDRRYEERGWRPVRQPWGYYELVGMPAAHLNNEPIGIDSSVASETDPVKLAGAALTAWVTGEAGYVLHHGAGIRAGGAADLAKGRQANTWEQPALEPALALIAGARAILPADLPAWDRHGHAWPSHPLDLHTDVGDPVEAGRPGCNRCYAATRGDQAVVVVAGIRDRFLATSKRTPFTVHRPSAWAPDGPHRTLDLAEADSALAILIR